MSAVTGSVRPVPVLAIGGVDVASGPAADGTLSLMALSGASVKWGRDKTLTQPSPATAQLSLFDPTGVWAATADLVGRAVTLRWTWTSTTRTYFRGRITSVDLQRQRITRPDGTVVHGTLVQLTASGVLTDLGNRRPPVEAWPAETMAARRTRVAALTAGPVSSIATRPAFDAAPVAAVPDASKVTALDLLRDLFDSTGADRMTVDPDTQAVGYVPRRAYTGTDLAGRLVRDSAARLGAFVALTAAGGRYVDARAVLYKGGVSRDMSSRLTRATVTWSNAGQAATITRAIPGADEAVVGVREVTLSTILADATAAGTAADELAAFAAGEASGWTLDPMTWETARTGGFETVAQALVLLGGAELTGVYWLQGSFLPQLGIRPVFGIMGGTITYRDAGWVVTWQNAPVSLTGGPAYELTWDHVDDGSPGSTLVWDDVDRADGLHPSVTYEDMQYVAFGLGVTTIPTDGA